MSIPQTNTRRLVTESFGSEFLSIYNQCGAMDAGSHKTLKFFKNFCFLEKRLRVVKFSKLRSESFHLSIGSFVHPVGYCYDDIFWTARTILIKLTGSIHKPLLMAWLDSGGQRSRSQQAVKIKSCEHHFSWTTWAVSMKLTGNNY